MKVTGDSGEMVEPQTGLLTSKEDPVLCVHLGTARTVPCRPGLGGAIVPRSGDHVPQPGEEPCPIDPWIVVPERSKYVDQQTLKLQENPEDVPTGELPRNMLLSVDRHLVQTIVPGTRLTIMGIYSIFQAANSSTNHKGAVTVRQPYIRIVGMEETNEASSRGPATSTQEEVNIKVILNVVNFKIFIPTLLHLFPLCHDLCICINCMHVSTSREFKKIASNQDACKDICYKIAHSIFGHDGVKKAVACLLFGGARKNLPDGVKLRGDITVLLLGDPSTAKSQFLKFVEKTAPIAVYTSGKGSSAAGLTASVIRDSSSKEPLFWSDGGVVCIDEFDKMRPEDRVAIHEAMEQQTISIAKAGITTVLNSRTSVLAAANPPPGRYDDLKQLKEMTTLQTAQDNFDLQTTILSRFDLIFIVKVFRMYDQDKIIASHIIKVHSSAQAASSDIRASKEENWLKSYICRVKSPRVTGTISNVYATMYLLLNLVKIFSIADQNATLAFQKLHVPSE
ncbi:DNA replication licensing factor MCM5 [Gossypium australe]|uniref:DNA helicase n=1 Tax=Gossypium australe TaxID=47621 RepID=A0A5B6X8L7_9ROSI|nr:DNA replication licensing factor MCM5 [Gossypium australe]